MSQQIETVSEHDAAASRLGLRLIFAGIAMMAIAAGFMWWKFGPSMFVNLLNATMNCF